MPGVAETLDWATALVELDAVALDPAMVSDTLGVLLKYQDDIQKMQGSAGQGAARRVEAGSDQQGEGDLRLSGQSNRPGGAP